jgi:hypothetical protein
MITNTSKESIVVWQEKSWDNERPEEPALLINEYMDMFTIEQHDRYVNVNYETIDELIRILKGLKKKNL